jgi:nicotinate-nucleotide adenylyltransferase
MAASSGASPPRDVAVFGGSFNPPHIAHVLAVSVVLSNYAIDELLVIPTFQHPFAKQLASFDDRVKMCELAVGWLPKVTVSRVEETLGGESRTLRTLEHVRAQHGSWRLRLVMGADILLESHKWYGFDRIVQLAPPIVLGRVGVDVDGAPAPLLPAISSTDIRAKVAAGAWDDLAAYVPRTVLAHIREHGLYASP